jgi:hypothetical protein
MQHTIQTVTGRERQSSINPVLAAFDRQLGRPAGSRAGTPVYGSADERQIFAVRIAAVIQRTRLEWR